MTKLTVYYADGTESIYMCTKITYDTRVMFAQLDDGRRICIPYANIFGVIEENSEEVTE